MPSASIADEVGVTKAARYYHFAAKEDILRELIKPLAVEVDRMIRRVIRLETPPREMLAEYIQILQGARPVMELMMRDPSVLSHAEIGRGVQVRQEQIQMMLAGHDMSEEGLLRAACAIGALQAGVIHLPSDPPIRQVQQVVDAAVAVLEAAEYPRVVAGTGAHAR